MTKAQQLLAQIRLRQAYNLRARKLVKQHLSRRKEPVHKKAA